MPTPVSYDPFAAPARASRGVPVSYDPFAAPASGTAQTRPRAASPALPQGRYGSEIEREALSLDPSLRVTGRERTAARNAQVGGVPGSAHLTDNARDFSVAPGETLEQARARLEKTFGPRGYKVLAEGAGAAHSTAPHLHIEATPSAQDFGTPVRYDPFAAPPKPRRGVPVAHDPFAAPAEPGWLDTAKSAVKNIPADVAGIAKGVGSTVAHPMDALLGAASTAQGAADTFDNWVSPGRKKTMFGMPASPELQKRNAEAARAVIDPYTSVPKFKKQIADHPVGTALNLAPLAGVGGKLLRGASRAGEAGEAAKAALPAEVRGRHIVEDQVNQMRNAALRAHHKLEPLYKAFQGDDTSALRDTVAYLQRDATPEAARSGAAQPHPFLAKHGAPVRAKDFMHRDTTREMGGAVIAPDGRIHVLANGVDHHAFRGAVPNAGDYAEVTTYDNEFALRKPSALTPAQARTILEMKARARRGGLEVTEGGFGSGIPANNLDPEEEAAARRPHATASSPAAPGMAAASRIGPHRVAASDTLREVLDQTGNHLNEITGTPLRKGYYPGSYLDAGKEGSAAGVARGGSRSQYKRKSYETQAEAVADGRVPKFEHPVEAVSNYVERTYRNLGLRAAIKALEEEGIAREVSLTRKGQAMVPKGWREIVPADARSGAYATHDELTDMIHFRPGKALIAPEAVANKINGLVAQGFEGSTSPLTRGAYAIGQNIFDATKMLKFAGSSLAHGANTLYIGVTDRMLSGVNALLRYKGWANAKDAPASFARNALPWRGGAAMRDRIIAGPEHMDEIDRAFEAAGGRVGATPDYDLGKSPGVAGPLARGAAGESWAGKVKGAFNALVDETKRAYAREVRERGPVLGAAKFTQGQLNAVLRDANALVFEKAIPLDKMALYRMRMEAWRAANPGASLDALHAQARKSVAAVDDMLGEIPLEKLMDSRRSQQLARMLLLAPSWVVGNLRAAGKGAAEIAGAHGWKEGGLRGVARESLPGRLVRGEGMGEHTQALATLMASRYIEGEIIAQIWHHLGKAPAPQSAKDLERPQTGGKNGYGTPERARFVSAGNDAAIDWRAWEKVMSGDPAAPTAGGYAFSKLNVPPAAALSLMAGRDLGDPTPNAPLAGRTGEYLKGQFNPIPAEGAGRLNKSSAIPGWATLLGISQAGEADSDPDTAKGVAAKREAAAAKAKARSDAAKAARMAN